MVHASLDKLILLRSGKNIMCLPKPIETSIFQPVCPLIYSAFVPTVCWQRAASQEINELCSEPVIASISNHSWYNERNKNSQRGVDAFRVSWMPGRGDTFCSRWNNVIKINRTPTFRWWLQRGSFEFEIDLESTIIRKIQILWSVQ